MANIQGWFRPQIALSRLYCRSELMPFPCHFVQGIGSARCPGPSCVICEILPPLQHGIVAVNVGALRIVQLIELRDRHAQCLAECAELGPELVGTPLFVWRDENEHGQPIEISLEKPEFAPRSMERSRLEFKPIPCSRYVASIGTREYSQIHRNWDAIRDQIEKALERVPA